MIKVTDSNRGTMESNATEQGHMQECNLGKHESRPERPRIEARTAEGGG